MMILGKALIFCFHLKKSAAETHRMVVKAYGGHALLEKNMRKIVLAVQL